MRLRRPGRHPRTTDRMRAFLAKVSMPALITEFLLVVAAIAAALAAGYVLTDDTQDAPTFWMWWKDLILALLSFPIAEVLEREATAGRAVLQLLTGIAGVVLPALFIGAVVLKLFVSPGVFVMRNRIVTMANPSDDPRLEPGGHHLAVRTYSSTPFRLLNAELSAIIKFERQESEGTTILIHRQLRVANPSYTIAYQHVPYTLVIPVDGNDWADSAGGELAQLQGYPVDDQTVLIVTIAGHLPELGSDFHETHDFPLRATLSDKPYTGLVITRDRPGKDWRGWEDFDERP